MYKTNKGFTLVELVIVIVIIGILSIIGIREYSIIKEQAVLTEAISNTRILNDAYNHYYQLHGTYPTSIFDLPVSIGGDKVKIASSAIRTKYFVYQVGLHMNHYIEVIRYNGDRSTYTSNSGAYYSFEIYSSDNLKARYGVEINSNFIIAIYSLHHATEAQKAAIKKTLSSRYKCLHANMDYYY